MFRMMALLTVIATLGLVPPVSMGQTEFANAPQSDLAALEKAAAGGDSAALKRLTEMAELHDPRAQSILGVLYYNGTGVAQDDSAAVSWLRKAAKQANARGQYGLGHALYNGRGDAKDEAEALRLIRAAAQQGYVPAQTALTGLKATSGQSRYLRVQMRNGVLLNGDQPLFLDRFGPDGRSPSERNGVIALSADLANTVFEVAPGITSIPIAAQADSASVTMTGVVIAIPVGNFFFVDSKRTVMPWVEAAIDNGGPFVELVVFLKNVGEQGKFGKAASDWPIIVTHDAGVVEGRLSSSGTFEVSGVTGPSLRVTLKDPSSLKTYHFPVFVKYRGAQSKLVYYQLHDANDARYEITK